MPSSITCIGDPAEFPHVAYPDGRLPFDAGVVGLTITRADAAPEYRATFD